MSNHRSHIVGAALTVASLMIVASASQAQWVSFANETAARMPVGPGLNTATTSTGDLEEKDYAWGDVDQDGDIDLVCVRKQPFTTTGRKPNVLFMNEGIKQGHAMNGVLVDRTAQFISATLVTETWDDPQVPGGALPDQGFLTWTNDRDVTLADVNNDGWLDIITAPALSNGTPKWIGHPRIYMNLRNDANGDWQGFRHEPARIPQMHPTVHPAFCAVAAGDVTGDGFVDLYFIDYSSSVGVGFDFNNKLLINRGATQPGFFDDSGTANMSANGLSTGFGASGGIADFNNDGVLDAFKQSAGSITVQHNNPLNPGVFPDAGLVSPNGGATYFMSAGDLNSDGRMDLITSQDSEDVYFLNTGNAPNGNANFVGHTFQPSGVSNGFGSHNIAVDLNNDSWNDVLIADVDVDIPGCGGRLKIYRNLGNAPNVTLQEQAIGGLNNSFANMGGTYHTAPFDINGDGWVDLVIGRCNGTSIWMNVPPSGIAFTYPDGLPGFITPNQIHTFDVQLTGISGAQIVPGSGQMFVSVNGGPFVQSPMTSLGGNLYSASLPAVDCTSRVRFYFSGQLTAGPTLFDPPSAPAESYLTLAALGTAITMDDTIEGDVSQWTISNGPGLTAGTWEPADPNATYFNAALAAPEDDATQSAEAVRAFVTLNGLAGGLAGASDIDGGATSLVSPVIDLAGADATITYSRWFFASLSGNSLTTEVSNNNGASWVPVDSVTSTITDGTLTVWESHSFVVGAYVAPTDQVRVRFIANGPNPSAIVEAAIDNLRVQKVLCTPACVADITGDSTVNVNDLLAVITSWGPCTNPNNCPADISPVGPPMGDDQVNVNDLLSVITAWGACP